MVTVHSVSSDSKYFEKDDYYAKGGQTLGVWYYNQENLKENTGIDLEKANKEELFKTLYHEGVGSKELVGKDLTFSAPKSVSIAWGIGDEQTKKDMEEAHHEAVQAALDYLNKNLAFTRETHNGHTEVVKGNGVTAIAYDHLLSREQDPQLHSHVVVLNQTKRKDGELRALHYDEIFKKENLYALDSIYKTTLANSLEKKGYSVEWDKEGKSFELSGFDREKIEVFSTREQIIKEYAEEHGLDLTDSEDRNRAILETRPKKEKANMPELEKEWRERAQKLGISIEKGNPITLEESQEKELAVTEAARQSLSLQEGVFNKEEFVRETLEFYNAQKAVNPEYKNIQMSVEDVERAFDNLKSSGDVVFIGKENGREIFASKEFIEAERRVIEAVSKEKESILSKEEFNNLKDEFIERFKQERGFSPSQEQLTAIEAVYTTDRQYIGVQGYAGTGKTELFAGIRIMNELLQEKGANGLEIYGSAPTGQAAKEIENKSKIESMTVNRMLNRAEKYGSFEKIGEAKETLPPDINRHYWDFSNVQEAPNRLIILDETGMADTRLMANVIEMADRMNARVIFSGDVSQFQSVGSGRAFDLMQRNGLHTVYLEEIRRQKDPFLRETAKEIATGSSLKAYDKLKAKGYINTFENKDKALKVAKEDFINDYLKDKDTFLIVGTNKDKDKLNKEIREELIKKGAIDSSKVIRFEAVKRDTQEKYLAKGKIIVKGTKQLQGKEFAKGDRIVFLKNDRVLDELTGKRVEVKNGNIGYIKDIEGSKLTVALDGKEIKFDVNSYKSIDHAYAITAHKSQGASINRVHSLLDGKDKTINRNAFYVHVTRTKKKFNGYVINEAKLKEKIQDWQKNKSAFDNVMRLSKDKQKKEDKKFGLFRAVLDRIKGIKENYQKASKESVGLDKDFWKGLKEEEYALKRDIKGMGKNSKGGGGPEIETKSPKSKSNGGFIKNATKKGDEEEDKGDDKSLEAMLSK